MCVKRYYIIRSVPIINCIESVLLNLKHKSRQGRNTKTGVFFSEVCLFLPKFCLIAKV